MPAKRPFGVTLLLWLVLSLSVWGLVRSLAALRFWDMLNEFDARLGPLYLFITGTVWILMGGALLWSLFRGRSWVRQAIPAALFLWLAEYWIERIFFEAPRANLPFALMTSILLGMVTLGSAFHPKTRAFFMRSEEHEQPNQYPEST
jgi:hypothetical protein